MKSRLTLALLVIALLPVVHLAAAEPVTITLDPDKVTGKIDEKIYSHFLEHIFHSLNGGLWGEMIWDRSFEGPKDWSWDVHYNIEETKDKIRMVWYHGDTAWKDYEFTVDAITGGDKDGFLVLFRERGKDFYWCNFNNGQISLERSDKTNTDGRKLRAKPICKPHPVTIEKDKWHTIRIRCEGGRFQIWVDNKQVIDFTDENAGLSGSVGVGGWASAGAGGYYVADTGFRNLKVSSLKGKVMYKAMPDPSMEIVPPCWKAYGCMVLTTDNPFNGKTCVRIDGNPTTSRPSDDSEDMYVKQGPMCIRAGETYRGSFYARGDVPYGMLVRIVDGNTKMFEKFFPPPTVEWKEVPFEFKAENASNKAELQVGIRGLGRLWIDQVSMMADSSKATGGFRPDLLKAVADLHPPVIRWPGGSFVHTYHWKDGIGPQAKRKAGDRMMWEDREVNSYGTDEFIAMCRKIGTEPLIVVNIGHKDPNNREQYLAEACEWVEYCNGPATSKWGAVRAANGHPEPYNVKYWEIDNEIWSMKPDDYVAAIRQFAPAMKKADPSIILLACGSGQLGGHWADGDTAVITQAAELVDYLSIHHYEKPGKFADGPAEEEAFIAKLAKMIAESKNPKLKLFVSEWNAQSIDWRTGLYAGGILNVFERCGDTVGLAAPALFLRHLSAKSWNNAFINFDHTGWFPAPNYVVMKLWRDHYAPNLISATGDMGGLNAVATKSADGKTVCFKAVNPTEQAEVTTLMMPDAFEIDKATMELVSPGSLEAANSLAAPDAVKVTAGETKTSGHAVSFTIPAYSAAVVTIQKK